MPSRGRTSPVQEDSGTGLELPGGAVRGSLSVRSTCTSPKETATAISTGSEIPDWVLSRIILELQRETLPIPDPRGLASEQTGGSAVRAEARELSRGPAGGLCRVPENGSVTSGTDSKIAGCWPLRLARRALGPDQRWYTRSGSRPSSQSASSRDPSRSRQRAWRFCNRLYSACPSATPLPGSGSLREAGESPLASRATERADQSSRVN